MKYENLQGQNEILSALPADEFRRIFRDCSLVFLERQQVLFSEGEEIQDVYFPLTGVISLMSIMQNGSTTLISLVGNEGMVDLPAVLGGRLSNQHVDVQIQGQALKLPAKVLKAEFERKGLLQLLLLRYTQVRLSQLGQSSACNRQHHVEARLARCLLSVQDCLQSSKLPLTQELIANMLGIRRSGVTVAARKLQQENVIQYTRGHITILDHCALENISCECYGVIRQKRMKLLE